MRIAISGAHGQGKTTLVEALKQRPEFKDYQIASSPTRAISKLSPIGPAGTSHTQMLIMMQHYANHLPSNVILDRCALDGFAYTQHLYKNISHNIYSIIEDLFKYLIPQYDIIFYIEPELPLVDDGVRPVDTIFFNYIKRQFEVVIKHYKIRTVSLSGSVEERVQKIINTYNIRKQFN